MADIDDPTSEPAPRLPGADVEQLLRRVHDVVNTARPMPLSTSVMINREEVLELLDESIERLPDELRAARWLLKEREEYLAKVRREGEEILDQARARAERMVQRTEVVKAAEQRARRIVDAAEAEARRLKNECEDFCDQKLASFEIVLERTAKMVAAGRAKLQGNALNSGEVPVVDPAEPEGPAVFDQDLS
jgi:F0F1-type ATP synthase membrane subunit b/b'